MTLYIVYKFGVLWCTLLDEIAKIGISHRISQQLLDIRFTNFSASVEVCM